MNFKIDSNSIDFNRLFPFFFVVDKSLQIIEVGKSHEIVYPNCINKNLKEVYSFKRPWSLKYTFESIVEYANQLIILESSIQAPKFRCQAIPLTKSNAILFVGTPWVVSVEEMHENKLFLNDFALHDILPDIFQFLKASEINTNDIKLLAGELKNQKDLLQNVIDLLPHQIFLKDLESRFILVNKKVEEIFGKPASEIVGKTYNEFHEKPDIEGDYNMSDKFVMKTRRKVEITQEPQVLNSGKHIVNHISKLPFEVNGELKGVLGIAIEISERLEYETKLKVSEDKYRVLIENALDIIFQINSSGKIIFINSIGIELTEYSLDELLSMSYLDLVRSDYRAKTILFYESEAFLNDPIHSYYEFPLISKNGREIWISQKVQPVFLEGTISGFQGFARDITQFKLFEIERIKSDIEIKESATRLKSLVENLNVGILVEDEDHKILALNDVFCEIFKLENSPSDYVGQSSDLLIANAKELVEDEETFLNTISKTISNKSSVVDEVINMKNGAIFERDYRPIFVKNEYKGQLWSYKDVSLRKLEEKELLKAKEQAEASSLAKEQFLSTMSHEIRTPMNAVIGITQLLMNNSPLEGQKEYLNAIKYSADNLLDLINNILDFSKIESGNIKLENSDFDLHFLIDKMQNIFRYQAEEKGLSFMIHLNHKVSQYLNGDTVRLNQILTNLIGNSFKFTETGSVEVLIYNSASDSKKLVFEVRDTGIGIAEENLTKIFERFTQANSDTTRKYGGTGLGLTITKLLVELLGGNIYIKSKVGVGTSFFVELPFEIGSKDLVLQNNLMAKEMEGKLSGRKVLLVEDNNLNQLIAKEFMSQWGLEVVTAENGFEAIKVLDVNQDVELILMDLQMPVMDGFTCTEYIRKNYQGKFSNLPIIALSAATSTDVKNRVVAVGMNDFISKPFESQSLFTKISEYLNLKPSKVAAKSSLNKQPKKDSIFSLKYYEDFSGGNKDFIREMLIVYLDETPRILEDLNKSALNNNLIDVSANCHKLKTSFTMLGVESADVKKLEEISLEKLPDLKLIYKLNENIQLIGLKSIKELKYFLLSY